MIVKAYVEFGHETSHTKSSSHTKFYWPILLQGVDHKVEKTCKKRCLKVVPMKCQR